MSEETVIRFYVSADGEVLSNTDHPVTTPLLIVPDLRSLPPIECEVASELGLRQLRFSAKLFRALSVSCAGGLFESEDGVIRPRRQPKKEQP